MDARVGPRATFTALAAASALAATAHADAGSLYSGPAPRPGPDILYAPPASAPQLQNTGVWQAAPILVSGATAYRGGEFLYQDFLYDDHGADGGLRDSADTRTRGDTFSAPNGTYTYPSAPGYAGNAADLVELRVRPVAGGTAFRLTLNSLVDPELVGATIAIGDSASPRELPHGANVSAPAELFLTLHGATGELRDAATGDIVAGLAPTWDLARRQVEVTVPHSGWDPGSGTVRLAAGVGLWDAAAGRYLVPASSATGSRPGGAGRLSRPAAFFNVAFRASEPWPDVTDPGHQGDPAWWRDKAQATALAGSSLGFHANVDFAKLAVAVDDDSAVPTTGPMNRILASRFEPHQGLDATRGCGGGGACSGWLGGRLQPYAVYVPPAPPPGGRYGLTLLLHSLAASYNQFSDSRNQSQFGDAGGNIVITPSSRGPDGWYYDIPGADTFEVWADVARRYPLDPERASIAGYSMGGYGTYKLATQYPDLFARAQPTVGPPAAGIWLGPPHPVDATNTVAQLASLRHVPTLMWVATADELVPISGTTAQGAEFDRLGLRHELDVFTPAEHLTFAFNDQYEPAAAFLSGARVARDPSHVTYVVNPTMSFPEAGTVADHAYWLSGLRVRSASAVRGTLDAVSHASGAGDPAVSPRRLGAGVLAGGTLPAIAFTRQGRTWGAAPPALPADRISLKATNVAEVTIHPARAGLTCAAVLDVVTDGPLTVTVAGCARTETFG